jgi:hypothetical protein
MPNGHQFYQMVKKYFQMVIKHTDIYNSKTLQNLPQTGIFGLKTNHLATLLWMTADRVEEKFFFLFDD